MAGKRIKHMAAVKFIEYVKRYKYVVLVVLAGVVLMLLPAEKSSAADGTTQQTVSEETFSLAETERRLEETLKNMNGVGQVSVMLTLKSGSSLTLAENRAQNREAGRNSEETDVVTLDRGSGTEDVVVTDEAYPAFQGALVVCQGASDSAVRLQVTQAVSVLTGLGSDKISVVQWK